MEENFREPTGSARAATIALALFMLLDLIFGLTEANAIWAIDGFQAGTFEIDRLEQSDALGMVAGGGLMLAYLIAVIASGRWIFRVNKNAQAQNQDWITVSPGWNIGFFFIPIANLFMPFRGLRQTLQVSTAPHAPEHVAIPALMPLWWLAWLAMSILGNISFRLSLNAETLDQLRTVAVLNLVTTPVDLLGTILFMMVIWRITRLQCANLGAPTEADATNAGGEIDTLATG